MNGVEDRQVEIGTTALLDASGSGDAEGKELTYRWSFISKPENSGTAIIGTGNQQAEFELDKAGSYHIKLTVDNGKRKMSDSLVITNKAPVISSIRYEYSTLDDNDLGGGDYAEKGQEVDIVGSYLSPDINENKVKIGGLSCQITFVGLSEGSSAVIAAIVPDEAVDGDVELTIGPHTVKWPRSVSIIHYPIGEAIAADKDLHENERYKKPGVDPNPYKEVGTVFKPLVKGKILGVGGRKPTYASNQRITLWDVATEQVIVSQDVGLNAADGFDALNEPVTVDTGKEYLVTFNEYEWFYYQHSLADTIFPMQAGDIEILRCVAGDGSEEKPVIPVYPGVQIIEDYIIRGPDIVFVADDKQTGEFE